MKWTFPPIDGRAVAVPPAASKKTPRAPAAAAPRAPAAAALGRLVTAAKPPSKLATATHTSRKSEDRGYPPPIPPETHGVKRSLLETKPLRTITGQDLPPVAERATRCPAMRQKNGEVTGNLYVKFEGDDSWYEDEQEAGRAWLAKFGEHFQEASGKLRSKLKILADRREALSLLA